MTSLRTNKRYVKYSQPRILPRCAIYSRNTRDLTDRQLRRPGQCRWKIDFASFHFLSRLSLRAQLIERRDFGLEIKRRNHTRVQTGMVEFTALPFPFPSKPKIGHSSRCCAGTVKKCTKKAWYTRRVVVLLINLLLFDVPVTSCRRRGFVGSQLL